MKIESNQVISQVVNTIALYSALAEDWETICYFLDFHEISASPRKIKYPVINLLE